MGIFEEVVAQSSRKREGLPGVLERRRTRRLPMLRTSQTSLTSHRWDLEFIPAFGLPRLRGDIDALAQRSLDTNIFFESSVISSAWPRLTSLLAPKGCWMVCLWATTGAMIFEGFALYSIAKRRLGLHMFIFAPTHRLTDEVT